MQDWTRYFVRSTKCIVSTGFKICPYMWSQRIILQSIRAFLVLSCNTSDLFRRKNIVLVYWFIVQLAEERTSDAPEIYFYCCGWHQRFIFSRNRLFRGFFPCGRWSQRFAWNVCCDDREYESKIDEEITLNRQLEQAHQTVMKTLYSSASIIQHMDVARKDLPSTHFIVVETLKIFSYWYASQVEAVQYACDMTGEYLCLAPLEQVSYVLWAVA